jgi:hypothetical protein
MGLTVYYDWKTKTDLPSARRLIVKLRAIALKLPFDKVSEIYEQDSPDGKTAFRRYDDSFRQGELYLSRKRADGERETVDVPALHALFFHTYVQGSESASIGLATHPPVVLHREDVIQRDKKGAERGRILGRGDAIEFPTGRRG